MNDRQPEQASPPTTDPRQSVNGHPLASKPVVDPAVQRYVGWAFAVLAFPGVVFVAMGALDVLAGRGVPVPALGYWDTLVALGGIWCTLLWLRWTLP